MTIEERFNDTIEYHISIDELKQAFDACDKLSVITNDFFEVLRVRRLFQSRESLSVLRDVADMAGVFYSAEGFWAKVKGVFVSIWNAIKKFFSWIWNGIKKLFGKGGKIPATDQTKALAEENPELKPLLADGAGGIAGLDAIKEFLQVMTQKNKVVKDAKPVKITDVESLQKMCVTVGTQFVQLCKEQAAGMAQLDPSKVTESEYTRIHDDFQQKFVQTAGRLQPEEIKAAVVTGKTDTLGDYFEKHYVKNTVKPEEVIAFISASSALSRTLQNSINQTNSGMETMQKDVMAKYEQNGESDSAKADVVGKVIQMGLQYARRFLGMEQGIYSFIVKYEKGLAESMSIIENWFAPTRDLNKKIAQNQEKQARAASKAEQEAEQEDED